MAVSRLTGREPSANSKHRVNSMKQPNTTVNNLSTATATIGKSYSLAVVALVSTALYLASTPTLASSHLLTTAPVPGGMTIDLLPGDSENTINLVTQRLLPIAIMGSASFDVNDLNPRTLKLRAVSQNLVGKSDKSLCRQQDINGDSYMDLICDLKTIGFHVEPGKIAVEVTVGTYQRQSLHAKGELTYRNE
jgi:hypothetical protein